MICSTLLKKLQNYYIPCYGEASMSIYYYYMVNEGLHVLVMGDNWLTFALCIISDETFC